MNFRDLADNQFTNKEKFMSVKEATEFVKGHVDEVNKQIKAAADLAQAQRTELDMLRASVASLQNE